MKTISALALLALLAVTTAQAQNVFVLGSNTTPPPDLNGNIPQPGQPVVQPVAAAAVAPAAAATVNVNVNVNTAASPICPQTYASPSYASYPSPYPQYYSPNVVYIGGPGTCGPNYYNYYPYQNNSVIYFGGLQAYRQGYHFRHCR